MPSMSVSKHVLQAMSLSKSTNTIKVIGYILFTRHCHKKPTNCYTSRSHTCGEINTGNVNQSVTVCGWLQFQRMNQFAILRDAYGTIQAYIPEERSDIRSVLSKTPLESVVEISGIVHKRPEKQINKKIVTGEVEINVDAFKVLNTSQKNPPFTIRNYNKANESTRLKYRYLDLRYPEMQKSLRFRSSLMMKMREFLIDHAFVEVETPTLFKKTPGGAQEFIVPTRFPGEFYSLVQSPQQLKQLLMVGGVDRYFQMARCYRDESARPDRQPEFTQLDIELSFSNANKVMSLVEDLLCYCWPESHGAISKPFKRIPYNDVLNTYGTDQPLFISELPIVNVSDADAKNSVKAMVVRNNTECITSTFRNQCKEIHTDYFSDSKLFILKYSNENQWQNLLDKCQLNKKEFNIDLKENDLVFISTGPGSSPLKLLGKVRLMLIHVLKATSTDEKWQRLEDPIWVVDFPLFEEGAEQSGSLKSVHHPFTSPNPEDLCILKENPLEVRGLHYDLVLNGYEIGGGSVRIHDANLQRYVLKEILNLPTKDLEHLLEALGSGAPPHAGIALGIDRLVAILVGARSIRDVIAFPKTAEGRDHLTGAPSQVTQEDLDIYRIKINSHKVFSDVCSVAR